MKINRLPCVLTIAGTDPTGGAGIQADIKTISALGGYAASVITVLVAQNTQGVQSIETIAPQFVTAQIDSVFSDMDIRAVKIGMLHNENIMRAVADALKKYQPEHVVVDPVMVAKNGSNLLHPAAIQQLKELIMPLATLSTPNLHEAERLLDCKITSKEDMQAAAKQLATLYCSNILVKGGHLNSDKAEDVLCEYPNFQMTWYAEARIDTKNTHGTGCTLSSAIATLLALNFPMPEAIMQAKEYLTHAILHGSNLQIGRGNGPVHHFYQLVR